VTGSYWDQRFKAGGRIWGDRPSVTAGMAEKAFRAGDVKNVLVPGAGYGRHTDFFADHGYTVTGVEVSSEALALARRRPDVTYHLGSVLELPSDVGGYDAVYCFNVLHLFRAPDRVRFIEKTREELRDGGLAFFSAFSEEEPQFGRGQEVEPGTFESKPGRPVHFFTDQDLRETFRGFDVIETGLVDDPENHGKEGPHTHRLRWILVRKGEARLGRHLPSVP